MTNELSAPPRAARRSLLWILLVLALICQGLLRVDRASQLESPEVLYVSSGRWLRRLSLGYNGLLADIYWTRAVQYYGNGRVSGRTKYRLLGRLLRITTALDPHLLIAYRFGAIFLAEKPPVGAGRPDAAMQLLRRGIVANPEYWRFWEDLGFIQYWDLRDYAAAARTFSVGSRRPGAEIWLKTLAASVAAKGGELRTSQILWTQVYRTSANQTIRQSALEHLAALKAAEDLRALDALLVSYRKHIGSKALTLKELVAAGLLQGLPLDPAGVPYRVNAQGRAALGPGSGIDLRLAH